MFPIAPMTESPDRLRSDRQKEDIHDKNKDAKDYLNKIETPHVAWSDSDAFNHFNNPVISLQGTNHFAIKKAKTIYPLPQKISEDPDSFGVVIIVRYASSRVVFEIQFP